METTTTDVLKFLAVSRIFQRGHLSTMHSTFARHQPRTTNVVACIGRLFLETTRSERFQTFDADWWTMFPRLEPEST